MKNLIYHINDISQKYISILPILMLLFLSPSTNIHAEEYLRGKITSLIQLQESINTTPGERVTVSLGAKDGMIKGDVLQISEDVANPLVNPIGKCALIKVDSDSGVCEILNIKKEVVKNNIVVARHLNYWDKDLYPFIYNLLTKTIEPYQAHMKVKVHVYDIFDDKNNVTEYSMKVKNEIESIFSQKNKIIMKKISNLKNFKFYPTIDIVDHKTVDDLMKEFDIDVFISGFYTANKNSVKLNFYKLDKQFGDEMMVFNLYGDELIKNISSNSEIILPFKPLKKSKYFTCNIILKELNLSTHDYNKEDIIKYEANGDSFIMNDLKTRIFNIIAPTGTDILLDNNKLNFNNKNVISASLSQGTHNLSVSFRRGYFLNTKHGVVYESKNTIKKDIIFIINEDDNINIEISIYPDYEKDSINFQAYKETTNIRESAESIKTRRSDKLIETFVNIK